MEIGLHNLKAPKGARKRKKILGRGPGSGHGKTSTRGTKGQTSRAGRDFYIGFEGGSLPLIRKIPKRGFKHFSKKDKFQILNLKDIAKINETEINPDVLFKRGLIKDKYKKIKILAEGKLNQATFIKAHAFSKNALKKIEEAKSKAELIHD
ncbi:MAG: 50S ribosomal protein L15 [Candidatus Omnitrophica bacterium]|nr:50S ribosomal protein L15 [Candidatus Omnitrophota bacterium]